MTGLRSDCVIVGGGIGGAVLALFLGRAGKHVVLLERETRPPSAGRPEILARSTLEVFHGLSLGERILAEAAVPLEGLELYQAGKLLLHFTHEDFQAEETQPYSTDPSRTRQILLEAAQATHSVEVCRGVEAKEILFDGNFVCGVRGQRGETSMEWHAPLVIGDDGGHSRVRACLGIALKTREFPLEFLGAAGPRLAGTKEKIGEAWVRPEGFKRGIFGGIFMPQPAGRMAFVLLVSAGAHRHFTKNSADFSEALRNLSPLAGEIEEKFSFPKDFTLFRRPFGHAPRYVANGAALLGDAAHPVTPAGGQGANGSVADAVVLAETALEAYRKNDFSSAQLKCYEMKRRPANERSLQFSVWARRVFLGFQLFPWLGFLLPEFLKKVDCSPQMKQDFIRNISTAFTTR